MKALKIGILAVALLGITGVAKAEGETPEKPVRSAEKVKSEICEYLSDLQISDFHLDDETVDVYFKCTPEGKVMVERVEGNSCVISEYVTHSLDDKKLFVDKDLQNTSHHVTVRYVVL